MLGKHFWFPSASSAVDEKSGFRRFAALTLYLALLGSASYAIVIHPPAGDSAPESAPAQAAPSVSAAAVSGIEAAAPVPRSRPIPLPAPTMQEPVPAPGWLLEAGADRRSQSGGDGDPRTFVTYANHDIDGGDYEVLKKVGEEACADRCKADVRCRSYTFNKWENVCFLKSSTSRARIEPRGTSGVLASEAVRVSSRPPVIQRSRAMRFPNEPYRVLAGMHYGACEKECLADARCLGFNFGKADLSCALIEAPAKSTPSASTDLGMKLQLPGRPSRVAAKPRNGPFPSDMPPEMTVLFDAVVRQMMRY
jgi:hypothetical protein